MLIRTTGPSAISCHQLHEAVRVIAACLQSRVETAESVYSDSRILTGLRYTEPLGQAAGLLRLLRPRISNLLPCRLWRLAGHSQDVADSISSKLALPGLWLVTFSL